MFDQRASIPEDVMIRDLAGESVLLNLNSETYFSLDEVGTRMWHALQQSGTVRQAYETLVSEYDVAPDTLRDDLFKLIKELTEHGLLALHDT